MLLLYSTVLTEICVLRSCLTLIPITGGCSADLILSVKKSHCAFTSHSSLSPGVLESGAWVEATERLVVRAPGDIWSHPRPVWGLGAAVGLHFPQGTVRLHFWYGEELGFLQIHGSYEGENKAQLGRSRESIRPQIIVPAGNAERQWMALETSGGVALLTSLPGRGQGITELVTLHLNPKLVLKSLKKNRFSGWLYFFPLHALTQWGFESLEVLVLPWKWTKAQDFPLGRGAFPGWKGELSAPEVCPAQDGCQEGLWEKGKAGRSGQLPSF